MSNENEGRVKVFKTSTIPGNKIKIFSMFKSIIKIVGQTYEPSSKRRNEISIENILFHS